MQELSVSLFITSIAETILKLDRQSPESAIRDRFEEEIGDLLLRTYRVPGFEEFPEATEREMRSMQSLLRRCLASPTIQIPERPPH